MATAVLTRIDTPRRRSFALVIGPALAAGLMVGVAESLFFAYALARTPVRRALGLNPFVSGGPDGPDIAVLVLISLLTIGAGSAFAWRLRRHAAWWRIALAGVCLLVASLIGVFIAGAGQAFADTYGAARAFQVAFALASATAALLCTASVAWLLQINGAWRKALLVGLATGAAYAVFALLVDQLPGWRVGGGDMAMPRVAVLGNLVAGTVGGTLAFRLFQR